MKTQALILKIKKLKTDEGRKRFSAKSIGAIREKLCSTIGLRKKGMSNSAYACVLTKYTRDTLTIRIGDHGANESNFLSHDKSKFNVSIVISDKMIVKTAIYSAVYSEVVYDNIDFATDKDRTLTEICDGLIEALETGVFHKGQMGEYSVPPQGLEGSGLGLVDREELKKSIIDAVTSQLLEWRKPWTPYCPNSMFKVRGKVVSGIISAYSLKPYEMTNSVRLASFAQDFNEVYGTSFCPLFVTKTTVEKNGWRLLHNNMRCYAYTPVSVRFPSKVDDKDEVERLKRYEAERGKLPSCYTKFGERYYRWLHCMQDVTLAENIEGNPFDVEPIKVSQREMTEYVENVIKAYSPNVAPVFLSQSNSCFYNPNNDEIHMVPPEGFDVINEYYSTRFHETAHSTLHPSRLNRSFPHDQGFGSYGYAMEELVAEMSAWILCANLGISFSPKDKTSARDNSTAYIGSWLRKAKELYDGDGERTLIEAYNCATKAVDFILKGVNIDDMIPDSVKAQEDAELSDITLFADERVRVVNVRRDSRIRFFFTTPPDADRREQLKDAGFHYSKVFKAWQVFNDEDGETLAWQTLSNITGEDEKENLIRNLEEAASAKLARIEELIKAYPQAAGLNGASRRPKTRLPVLDYYAQFDIDNRDAFDYVYNNFVSKLFDPDGEIVTDDDMRLIDKWEIASLKKINEVKSRRINELMSRY